MTDSDSTNHYVHTDIPDESWADRRLPPYLRPYARLARMDRPIGTWLLLLPGLWAITAAAKGPLRMSGYDWYMFALFIIGAFIMRAAGCVINDLWDRKIDAEVERTRLRPLASGEISPLQGIVFLVLLLWIGFIILLQLSPTAILLGMLSVVMVVIYPLSKRVTWYPQFILGLTFNMGALMGWAAIKGQLAWPALLLYMAGIAWTLGYDTIYAHQDREDDAVIGIKSTALKFGDDSPKWIVGFYAATSFFILQAGAFMQAEWAFYAIWALASFHLIAQLYFWNKEDAASSLKIFRSNRDFGLLVLLSLALAFIPF